MVRKLVVALILSVGWLGEASAAEAHSSSYCGHGRSGYWQKTVFYGHWDYAGRHWHQYAHYGSDGALSHWWDIRAC